MNQEDYERSIDEVVNLGAEIVTLNGFGEPLLDKNLEKKIIYAKSKGLKTYFITNGSLLKARAEKVVESGLDELRISFYGMSAETYDGVMRGLHFDRTMEGIHKFLSLRKHTKVQLSYLQFDNNEPYQEFLDYWEPLVDYVEVWKPHNFGTGRDYRAREGIKKSCGRPRNGPLQIQWDGTVIPCCYDYNNEIKLGNAFTTPVMSILHGSRYEALRKAHDAGDYTDFSYCGQCDQLLEHTDSLLYTNRHNLPKEEAVRLVNTSLTRFN